MDIMRVLAWVGAIMLAGFILAGVAHTVNAREVTGECLAPLHKVAHDIAAVHGEVMATMVDDRETVEAIVEEFPNSVGITFATMPETVTVFGPIQGTVVILVFHTGDCVVEVGQARATSVFALIGGTGVGSPDDLNI